MKYFSMFSGIGGFELGIQRAFNMQPKDAQLQVEPYISSNNGNSIQRAASCIGYSEIDKYAIKVYERRFNGHKNYGDATAINPVELPDFDLLVGGFPCQAFSIAGKRAGFNDTRGTLFFDIARILAEKRPRHLVLENVKGLLSHDSGKTFQTILGVLSDLGYRVEWQVLNSKDFGVPQNRERIYIVGHLRGECSGEVLPIGGSDKSFTQVHPTIDANYYKGYSNQRRMIQQLNQPTHSNDRVYGTDGVSPTLNTMQGGNRQPFVAASRSWPRTGKSDKNRQQRLEARTDGSTNTLTAVEKDNYVVDVPRIRRLTPKECERLQGFPDDWTELDQDGQPISDTQRYKMAGNAVTTNVVEAVITNLIKHLDD